MDDSLTKTAPAGVLEVEDLRLCFKGRGGLLHALSGISFSVQPGEVLGLVGESGCGKSVTALSIMRLLPGSDIETLSGTIRLKDEPLLTANEAAMRAIRGNRIAMIFQDPMTSLNPTHSVGRQIAETVRRHRGWSWRKSLDHARMMLDRVRIPDAANRVSAYPHELSGGMRQRAMIAMALACDPELLIADEPTTALDVTVQAQILALIDELRRDLDMSVILITHDLGVVAQSVDRLAVMYAGRIVEEGRTADVFSNPSHGYTAGLLEALPDMAFVGSGGVLAEISGSVPRLDREIADCAFAPRCRFADAPCLEPLPEPKDLGGIHRSSCIHADRVLAAMRDNDIVRAWS